MKRFAAVLILGLLVAVGWAAYQASNAHPASSLAALMPQNALLYMEANDFSALLRQWNESPEKQSWLTTDNYEVFSRSRLFLRLKKAQSEFAVAAGLPPDMSFLKEVAGQESALGIYDIGKLELLFITRMPQESAGKTGIWQQRTRFESRETNGHTFYVRTDPQSQRVVAFAQNGDYLILATREDLIAGALALMSGAKDAALSQQGWFVDATRLPKTAGELRMIVHLAEVAKTPQFRTYWVQQNITEMQGYESSISDLYRSEHVYREERSLLLQDEPQGSSDPAQQVAELMRLLPANTGFYRALAMPAPEDALALVQQKVLLPRVAPVSAAKFAPAVPTAEQSTGSASDFETRIDVAPEKTRSLSGDDDKLKSLIKQADVRAALELHSSAAMSDGVFVRLHSTVVLRASREWDERSVLDAVQQIVSPGLTTSRLGAQWRRAGSGPQSYSELDGLARVCVAVRGRELFVSNDHDALGAVLEMVSHPAKVEPAIYYAGFDHSRERNNFQKLFAVVDLPSRNGVPESPDRTPQFFSQNIASLSKTLSAVNAVFVEAHRDGRVERQTVRYEWAK